MSDQKDEPARDGSQAVGPPPLLAAVLGMDLQDSEAAERAHEAAFKAFMALLREQVKLYSARVGRDEGAGDSIRQGFTDVREALHCAFHLRRAAQQPIRGLDSVYVLEPRIVLHFDRFTEDKDGRVEGVGQILVARLDPVVPPGEIWATDAFVDIARHLGADKGVAFEYVGQRKLAKESGNHPCYAVIPAVGDPSSRIFQRPHDPVQLAMRLFDRGDQQSQAGAVEALGTIESESASRRLVDIALNLQVDRRVRHEALVVLQERGSDINDDDTAKISKASANKGFDIEARALLLLVLGETGREGVFDTLSNVIRKTPPMPTRLREAALLAMRNLRVTGVADVVQDALKGTEEHPVRIAACVAAASGRMPNYVQARLHEIAGSTELPTSDKEPPPTEESMDLRRVACEALSSQPATRSLREMLKQLVQERSLSRTLRRYAMDGLARFDDPVAVQVVEEVARRMEDDLQVDAIVALAAMRAPRRTVHRRAQEPTSYLAEVIRLRTRPQGDGPKISAQ
jgi:HEAT repeat protein